MALIQNLIFGLELGSFIAIAAIGFTIIYGIVNMINFAYGEYMTIGAYVGFFAMSDLALPLPAAIVVVMVLSGILGWIISRIVFVPNHDAGPIPLLLISIGLGFVLRNGYRILLGGRPRYFDMSPKTYRVESLDFFITTQHLTIIAIALVSFIGIHLLLTRTDVGIAMRATSDNEKLSTISGIYTDKIRRNVWLLSSALAGLSGFMLATTTAATPLTGFHQILLVLSAAILGGAGSAYGAIVGAYIIGLTVTMATAYLPGEFSNLGTMFAFVILIVVLLVRPTGIADVEEA
ncbi:branched-chain amino acid ABC transporter permease [Natrinema gelatinilyticum]|uniref:branched-chain amino acid ABC transporter permease n=1 Tax=Natrinema gelatinilyticum TaxID=2961571 RepID=UPI0020C5AB26|nr:branched-chain amino acid ABC transporter permease [Natrinema gelatinilyticum]